MYASSVILAFLILALAEALLRHGEVSYARTLNVRYASSDDRMDA